jgi:hypothetical protein
MKATYSLGFIEQALVKVYSRGDRTVKSVAEELNVNCHTITDLPAQQLSRSAKLMIYLGCRRFLDFCVPAINIV